MENFRSFCFICRNELNGKSTGLGPSLKAAGWCVWGSRDIAHHNPCYAKLHRNTADCTSHTAHVFQYVVYPDIDIFLAIFLI